MKRGTKAQAQENRRLILEWADDHPTDLVAFAAAQLGMSRQAAKRQVDALVADGRLVATGHTRARTYTTVPSHAATLPLAGLEEDRVWAEHFAPFLTGLPRNVRDMCIYGVTEMVNNAIDHSEGTTLTVRVEDKPDRVVLWVSDDGVGIFRKIQRELGLFDQRQAILELSKGKFTTDPERHTGQGIFFSARAFDEFSLMGGEIALLCRFGQVPWGFAESEGRSGTLVRMEVAKSTVRTLKQLFDEFSTDDDYNFDRTHVPLRLAALGDDQLVSRSQAKRVLARFDRFKEVLLDFSGVATIGQAFADELFRVFPSQHPEVRLVHVQAGPEVGTMIRRAQAGLAAGQLGLFPRASE